MRYILLPILASSLVLGACSTQDESPAVSFKNDLMPILQANCVECHNGAAAEGTAASGVLLDSYAGVMKGTKFGPIVDPGHPAGSVLNQVIEGRVDKSIAMPHGTAQPLPEAKQKLFRDWVAQGAKDN
jgi:hypothetical protein